MSAPLCWHTAPVAKLSIDLTPIRVSRDFRSLFFSGLITYFGNMITYVALPFQMAQLTNSFAAVGLIGVVELIPLVVFGLYGGTLADTVDRRRLVLIAECAALVFVLVLCANALVPSPQIWLLYVMAFALSAIDGLQGPSLNAILPRVVSHDQLAAAGALRSVRYTLGAILGPAIGGLLVAFGGAAFAYGIDALTFGLSVLLLLRLRPLPPLNEVVERAGMAHILEGVRYALSRRDLLGTYLIDLCAMIFAFPVAMYPFLAKEFDAEWALGMLYAATAAGAFLVTITSGWVSHVHRHGRLVAVSAVLWGLGIGLIAFAPSIWWVLALLMFAGAADMVSGLFRGLIWNQTIPDEVRGRMGSIEMLSYSVGPLLGQVRSSTAASLTSLRTSFATGGLLCIVGVVVSVICVPAIWAYDVRTNEHAERERRVRSQANEPPAR